MNKLGFIAFGCEDVEQTKIYYEKLFAVSFAKEDHGDGKEHYSAKLNDLVIELFNKKDLKEPVLFGYSTEFISRSTSPEGYGVSCYKRCAYCTQPCYKLKTIDVFGPVNYCSTRCHIALCDLLDGVSEADTTLLWSRMINQEVLIREAAQRSICYRCGDNISGHHIKNKWVLDQHTCK